MHRFRLPIRALALVMLPLALLAGFGCGNTDSAATADAAAAAPEDPAARSGEPANWFEISGNRSVEARPATASIVRLSDLPLYGDDYAEGFAVFLRQPDVDRPKAARVELLPIPLEAGTYELATAGTEGPGGVGASVVIPKEDEKVILPMAIYGGAVSGTLEVRKGEDGALSGDFTLRAYLDREGEEPSVEVRGAFAGLKVPGGEEGAAP